MKQTIFLCSALFMALLVACGGGESESKENETPAQSMVEEKADDVSANPDYKKGLALVASNDCLTCHQVNQTTTGPAYADIAAKYAGAADTTISRLAKHIIEGGFGVWGSVPMTPHPGLSEEDAIQMVKYVLLLNKK